MDNYVYMVRSAWYDEYHVFGIYRTKEAAREALDAYAKKMDQEEEFRTYKWRNKSTVVVYVYNDYRQRYIEADEYKIVRVPLDRWTDRAEIW